MTSEGQETPSGEGVFAAARELVEDDEVEASRHAQVQARRSAESGPAILGPGPIIGRSWPMPRQLTRLIGLVFGVTAVLLLAAAHRGWVWGVFGAAVVVAAGLAVRVLQSKVVLEAQAIRVQGVFRTSVFEAQQIRDIEVVDDTPATLQARVGPIPRVQTCRLVMTNGRRVTLSTATVPIGTALANLPDTELRRFRDVLEAWLTEVRGPQAGG